MNYKSFLHLPDLTERMLTVMRIIGKGEIILKIDNTPDHDISTYRREIADDYYFQNNWTFEGHFAYLIDIEFAESRIYDYSTLSGIGHRLDYPYNDHNASALLTAAYNEDKDSFSDEGIETNIDQFQLKHLRTKFIDNVEKQLLYEGAFFGDNTSYGALDYWLFVLCEYTAVPIEIEYEEFYKSILAEAYILCLEKNYKMSYFIAFTAIENFVYSYAPQLEEEKERFNEKLKTLFAHRFRDISKHQIYTSIIADFNRFIDTRNDIAHGRSPEGLNGDMVIDLLNFILIMIMTFDGNLTTFDELANKLS